MPRYINFDLISRKPGRHDVCFLYYYGSCCQPRWLSGLKRCRVHSLWLLVDHCVLRNWDRILVRAVKGLIYRAGMVSICPLLWQRDVKLPTNKQTMGVVGYFQKIQFAFTVWYREKGMTKQWCVSECLYLYSMIHLWIFGRDAETSAW